jgi:spermidine/putrescine-binding protein
VKRVKSLIAIGLVGGFAVGVGWGVWRNHAPEHASDPSVPLRVLCQENWLSQDVLDRFSQEHQVHIQLFTYARPGEFLRQIANSDGKIDVICTSSWLVRGLIRSHWLKKVDYMGIGNVRAISVDFLHLPFDPQTEYAVPLFWNLYGFWTKTSTLDASLKETVSDKNAAIWGDELALLALASRWGLHFEERSERDDLKTLREGVRHWLGQTGPILSPKTTAGEIDSLAQKHAWMQVPLSLVAAKPSADMHFLLPIDGGSMEVGLLAIGSKAVQPDLAMQLINDLESSQHAMDVHKRLGAGVVHKTLDNVDTIPAVLRPQGLRSFPLTRLYFPDLSVEYLPTFERIYSEDLQPKR